MGFLTFFAGLIMLSSPGMAASNPAAGDEKPVAATTVAGEIADLYHAIEEGELFFDCNSPRYDSLLHAWHEQNSVLAFENFFDNFVDIEADDFPMHGELPDSVYEARLRMILSPVPLPYNHIVKKYIINYTERNRGTMRRILGRSQYYFPVIEQELDRAGLPLELRALPIVESALSPAVKSGMGAVGLWQFMLPTGKRYGLEITSFIDERCDPKASTRAATAFLSDLYNMYGDWLLALAAYNCGPGNVSKALKKAGDEARSFWDIYPYLPKETRGYVPSFIAVTYAYYYHRQHDLSPNSSPLPLATDTVRIDRVMHFEQVCSTIGTPVETIRSLNPHFTRDIVPAVGGKSYPLVLPLADVLKFVEREEDIMCKDVVYLREYLKPSNIDPNKNEFSLDSFTYKVKSGDTLSGIAKHNGVTVSQIMKWNNLKSADKLRIGQKLEIYR